MGALTAPLYDNDAPASAQLAEVAGQPLPAGALRVLVFLLFLLMPAAMVFAVRLARRGAPGSPRPAARFRSSPGPRASPTSARSRASTGTAPGWRTGAPSRPSSTRPPAAPSFNTLIAIFVLGHLVGMLALGIGLWRSRAVPAWVGILCALSPILHGVGMNFGPVADTIAYALLGVAMLACAVRLVRRPGRRVTGDLPARRVGSPASSAF